MATVSIVINQSGLPTGIPGQSRDDIKIGIPVVLTNYDNSGTAFWQWSFVSWPQSTPDEAAPTITGALLKQASFIPTYSGTYIIKLIINKLVFDTIGITIKTANTGMILPAEGQLAELEGTFTYYILDSLHKIDDYGAGSLIQGKSVSSVPPLDGQVLVWNNTASMWSPQVQDGYRLQNRAVSSSAPLDGYLLAWNNATSQWQPQTLILKSPNGTYFIVKVDNSGNLSTTPL